MANLRVLVVGGGGGGGEVYWGGGGGGGGVIENLALSVTAGAKTVTVGNGGSGATPSNGDNSVFDSLTAIGKSVV